MVTKLPQSISVYIEAGNTRDTDSLLTNFAADARVTDEGRDYYALDEIREWSNKVTEHLQVALAIFNSTEVGDESICTVQVSGTFDGSPIQPPFHFTVKGDESVKLSIAE